MDKHSILTKTGRGARTAQECRSVLSESECTVLMLVDGKQNIEAIRFMLPMMEEKVFIASLETLIQGGHVRLIQAQEQHLKQAGDISVVELSAERGVREWAAATRAANDLGNAGFYLSREAHQDCEGDRQVLVIDDDAAIGDAVRAVLGVDGYHVEHLSDPRKTLDKIDTMPCLVLILLDIVMPHEDGFDVLRKIRSRSHLHRLPVIMLSAHANPEYVAEGLRDGADGYILKPFTPERLIQYITKTLHAH